MGVANDSANRKKVGEYLLEAGLITEDQLKEALRRQRQTKEPLGKTLARAGMVTEADICLVLHQQLGLPIVDLQTVAIDESVLALVKEELAKKYVAIPIELENRNTIRVAMADPLNASALEDIRFQSLFRLAFRSTSKCWMDTSSTPAAPRLAFTFS